jgi:hypothetical protein
MPSANGDDVVLGHFLLRVLIFQMNFEVFKLYLCRAPGVIAGLDPAISFLEEYHEQIEY